MPAGRVGTVHARTDYGHDHPDDVDRVLRGLPHHVVAREDGQLRARLRVGLSAVRDRFRDDPPVRHGLPLRLPHHPVLLFA